MNAVLPILCLLFSLSAQVPSCKGHINGTITDSSDGQPVVGASVMVLNTDFGAASDAKGFFTIRNIPSGTFSLKVTYIGFQPIVVDSVEVKPDSTLRIDLHLKPSANMKAPIVVSVPNTEFKMRYFKPDSSIDYKMRIYTPNQKSPVLSDSTKSRKQK